MSKIALFQMSAILKFDFQKIEKLRFLSKLSKLHKKDPILHVATTFSLKQGETRTSHEPIPHPLRIRRICRLHKVNINYYLNCCDVFISQYKIMRLFSSPFFFVLFCSFFPQNKNPVSSHSTFTFINYIFTWHYVDQS